MFDCITAHDQRSCLRKTHVSRVVATSMLSREGSDAMSPDSGRTTSMCTAAEVKRKLAFGPDGNVMGSVYAWLTSADALLRRTAKHIHPSQSVCPDVDCNHCDKPSPTSQHNGYYILIAMLCCLMDNAAAEDTLSDTGCLRSAEPSYKLRINKVM